MAKRTYIRNKLGQFSGGKVSKEKSDSSVSKQTMKISAPMALIQGVANRASSTSSGKGVTTRSVSIKTDPK